jgi:histidyl-tRNA synthetase
LLQALGISGFKIHINNRQVLTGLLQRFEIADRSTDVLRALDKLPKIGASGVAAELQQVAGLSDAQAAQVLKLATVHGTADEVLAQIQELAGDNPTAAAGVERLRTIVRGARAAGVAADYLKIDVSIARGLDYYTGVVFETFLDDLPSIGSICSGGRYDNLAGMFTKQHLPGVGASLGLDRLLAALQQLDRLPSHKTTADVLVVYFQADRLDAYLQMVSAIRAAGIGVELYPEAKKLGQQLKYADQRNFRLAVVAGSQEFEAGRVQLKDLRSKISTDVPWDGVDASHLVSAIRSLVSMSEGRVLA